ncbi:hypothetical protein V8D89_013840, partial [Ganoderma adspersum]
PLPATTPHSRQATPSLSRSRDATPGPSCLRNATPGPAGSRHATPGPSQPRSVHFPSQLPASDDEGGGKGGEHEITKLGEPDSDSLIPKPNGEVSRKTHGYFLPDILGWDSATYRGLREKVKEEVSKYLDHNLSAFHQPAGAMQNMTKLVVAADYPIVSKFRDAWPITDIIHLHLKYTSGRRHTKPVDQAKGYKDSALRKAMV